MSGAKNTLSLHPEIVETLHPNATTAAEQAAVRRIVARHATDEHDAAELLRTIGVPA